MLKSPGKPEEEAARKPEKKKKEIQTNRQGTVGLGKIKGRKKVRSMIRTYKNL